jgi:hypothetical protein
MTSRWWLNKVEIRGTGMLTVEDQLGKCYLQRDARPLQIYVCYGSVACSMRKRLRQMRGLFELNRKKMI